MATWAHDVCDAHRPSSLYIKKPGPPHQPKIFWFPPHLEKSPPPNFYFFSTKIVSFPQFHLIKSYNQTKTWFLAVDIAHVPFFFNFILYLHMYHANFYFNWCSVFTESYFQLWKMFKLSKSKSFLLRFSPPGKKISPSSAHYFLTQSQEKSLSFRWKRTESLYWNLQSLAKYLQQNREIHQNWAGQEKFHIYFCVVFDCYCQSLISGRKTGH